MSAPAPAAEEKRLHPASLVVRWLKIVPQMLAGGIGLAATSEYGGLQRFILFAMFAGLLGALFALVSWWRFLYAIGPGEIVIEKGVLRRSRRVIPFDRVQDVAIERGLIARLFGTARVRVETGGAARDEGELDMVALGGHRCDSVPSAPAPPRSTRSAGREPVLFAWTGRGLLCPDYSVLARFPRRARRFVSSSPIRHRRLDEWDHAERPEAASRLVPGAKL